MPGHPRRALRPAVAPLEGRLLLAATRRTSAAHPALQTEALAFDQPSIVSQQSSSTTLTLRRRGLSKFSGNSPNGTYPIDDAVQVHVTTEYPAADPNAGVLPISAAYDPTGAPTGLAAPGVQYIPVDETVTFAPGESEKAITIPIVAGAENPGRMPFVAYAVPTSDRVTPTSVGIVLGAGADVDTPRIVSTHVVIDGHRASGLAIRFSKPMDVASVTDLRAYKVADVSHQYKRSDLFFYMVFHEIKDYSRPVKLEKATWDASTNTVTLIPDAPLLPNGRYSVEARASPRRKGHPARMSMTDRYVAPLRDVSGNVINDFGYGGGGFNLDVTRTPTDAQGRPIGEAAGWGPG